MSEESTRRMWHWRWGRWQFRATWMRHRYPAPDSTDRLVFQTSTVYDCRKQGAEQ